jgi:cell division protein FtsL
MSDRDALNTELGSLVHEMTTHSSTAKAAQAAITALQKKINEVNAKLTELDNPE